MVSRLLGFVRDVILARLFGAGEMADAFFVAFRVPNLFRRLFGEGAFPQSFVPVLGEYRTTRSPAETRAFVEDVAGWLALTLAVVTVVGMLAASAIVYAIAPGFADNPAMFSLTVELLRITFPYLFSSPWWPWRGASSIPTGALRCPPSRPYSSISASSPPPSGGPRTWPSQRSP